MRINLIYARAANGVIGHTVNGVGAMPWHLPEDLAHFRRTTQGCPVVMGRKTWDSLPPRFRPLPGRLNVVLSRQPGAAFPGAQAAAGLPEALALLQGPPAPEEVWIMGGAQIYQQALPLARRVVVTEIAADFEGDAYAPTLGPEWSETARDSHTSAQGLPFAFVTYERQGGAPSHTASPTAPQPD
jgi:dihydrofolate reductase